jgi:hypothetical protein
VRCAARADHADPTGRSTGQPRAVFLLGYHRVEIAAQVGLYRGIGSNDVYGPPKLAPPGFESPDEGETTTDSATVAKIILTFDTLRSETLPRGASRDLIMKVAEEYGRDLA